MRPEVPRPVAERARELRVPRRTRSGTRSVPWQQIADELALEGAGRWQPEDLADAVAGLPLEEHPDVIRPSELAALERGFRDGWAEEFPGEPWPGFEVARRRLRQLARPGGG